MRSQKGFTLIEMLIVLLIIAVLLMIIIPNVTRHFTTIGNKGCEAYMKMVQGQTEAYKIDNGRYPTSIAQLVEEKYLKEGISEKSCPGRTLLIVEGEVKDER